MNHGDIDSIVKGLAPAVMAYLSKGLENFDARIKEQAQEIAELRKCLADRPMPVEPDLEAIAALVKLPEVKDGEPGKDAEVDLNALAEAAAKLVVLPEVKDGAPGKDAEPVDLEALAKAAAALIPLPQDGAPGKDADPVDLKAVAALVTVPEINLEEVAKLVSLPQVEKVDVEAIARAAAALIPVPEVKQPEDGRDAIDLEILPAIDDSKQYPRGTYAAHNGGLWKSYERTHGMRGWECIVDGIASASVTQDAVREFSVTLVKSSGAEVVQKFAMPIQVYQGVYDDKKAYDKHDNVTWGGSQWTSTKAANTDKPGTSDAWTLVVKAGRPGKDLRENASTFDASKGVKL